jgi:hypothetical protein
MLVLARAIHALCRIGDELYVEPEPAKLSFRAVSASKSAYASFTFSESFFSCYNYEQTKSQEEDVTCKVSMKVLYFSVGKLFYICLYCLHDCNVYVIFRLCLILIVHVGLQMAIKITQFAQWLWERDENRQEHV